MKSWLWLEFPHFLAKIPGLYKLFLIQQVVYILASKSNISVKSTKKYQINESTVKAIIKILFGKKSCVVSAKSV